MWKCFLFVYWKHFSTGLSKTVKVARGGAFEPLRSPNRLSRLITPLPAAPPLWHQSLTHTSSFLKNPFAIRTVRLVPDKQTKDQFKQLVVSWHQYLRTRLFIFTYLPFYWVPRQWIFLLLFLWQFMRRTILELICGTSLFSTKIFTSQHFSNSSWNQRCC